MNILLPALILFIMSVVVIELCFFAYRTIRNPDRQKIKKRLRTFSSNARENDLQDITRTRVLSEVPLLNKILLNIPITRPLDRLLQQANVQYPIGFFILLTCVLGIAGYLVCSLIAKNVVASLIVAALAGGIPFLYLRLKRKKRMEKFQAQLPEALDLIGRALRAGHAFTSGMKLAADEFDDPLGPEFDETLNEVNFGISVPDALKNLSRRVDCADLKYFVVSVILQRETGGNLAEIIESIAHIIRERYKFKGKVRTLSAEGKLSAIILVAIPFLVVIALRILNPEYISTLFTEPAGRMMAGIAAFIMFIGILFIKKMVAIKV